MAFQCPEKTGSNSALMGRDSKKGLHRTGTINGKSSSVVGLRMFMNYGAEVISPTTMDAGG